MAEEDTGRRRRAGEQIGGEDHRGAAVGGALAVGERDAVGVDDPGEVRAVVGDGGVWAQPSSGARWPESPAMAWAMAHSAVSAAVTHGWFETQRTPLPSITNSSQRSVSRRVAAAPVTTPVSTG